jgi:hypothetical protein
VDLFVVRDDDARLRHFRIVVADFDIAFDSKLCSLSFRLLTNPDRAMELMLMELSTLAAAVAQLTQQAQVNQAVAVLLLLDTP